MNMIGNVHEATHSNSTYDASVVIRCRIDGGIFDRALHKALLKIEPFIDSPLQPSELFDAVKSGHIASASSKARAAARELESAGIDLDSQREIDGALREFVGRVGSAAVPWRLSREELAEFDDLERVAGSAHVTVRWIAERMAIAE